MLGRIGSDRETVTCGMISGYNKSNPDEIYGVKNLSTIVTKRLKIQGFIVSDPGFGPKYAQDHQKNVSKWIADGTFKTQMSTTVGIDNAIQGLLGMLRGDNFGKAVLEVAPFKVGVNARAVAI